MKKKMLLLLIVAGFTLKGSAQIKIFNVKDAKELPDTAVIFMAALWCGGCIEKQKIFESFHKNEPALPYVAIYDPRAFTTEKRKRILKDSPDEVYVWAPGYFDDKVKKMKKKMEAPLLSIVEDFEKNGYTVIDKEKIWWGIALIKRGNTLYVQRGSKNFRKYVDAVLKQFDMKLPLAKG